MPVSNLIAPSHVILLPAIGTITVMATIEAAVVATMEAPVAVTEAYTICREAVLMTDLVEATPDGDLIHRILLIPGPDVHLYFTEGINIIHIVKASPDHLGEGMATAPEVIMAQSLQIANTLDVP